MERKGGTQFTISMKGSASGYNANRVFVLRADEPQECEDWVAALQKVSIDGKAHNQKRAEKKAATARAVHGVTKRSIAPRAKQPAKAATYRPMVSSSPTLELGSESPTPSATSHDADEPRPIASRCLGGCWPF